MKCIMEVIFILSLLISWIAGVVLAQGAWKIAAFIFVPYAWYLVVEKIMIAAGVI